MIEVSHVVYRCVNCSVLRKLRTAQYLEVITKAYLAAHDNDCSEIVILCDDCRNKEQRK